MTSEQFQRVKQLFTELESLSPAEQSIALETRCADDSVVRAEVQRLLATDGLAQEKLGRVTSQIDRILAPIRANSQEMIGQRVGPYEVIQILGQGGMGVVYLAHDTRLDRKAALKAVLPDEARDALLVERLRREARVLASLSHPNVATVYGLEESHDTFFLAMEYVEGKSLSQRLGRNAMPIADALSSCEQIAAGLEAAHDQGVIHRDLKPGNVMFTADGMVKVLDFGLARSLREKATRPAGDGDMLTLTKEGSLFGTPAYMSPEQARGDLLDHQTDIFSFGAILFRCLAGRPAFEGESLREVIDAVLTHEPDWSRLPANLPASVTSILKRCLKKDPVERYRNIGDVKLDLRDAAAAQAWKQRAPSRAPSTVRRLTPWAIAGLSLLLAAAGFWRWSAPNGSSGEKVQRFDVTFPADTVQGDLERVQLALSPDGRDIVVACKTQDGQGLWMRSHVDGQWKRIDQTEGGHRPFFSPDGQWITFFRAGQLYKRRPSGGGDPIRLAAATNWYGASWTADGSLIYSAAWGDALQKIGTGESKPQPCTRLDLDRGEITHISPAMVSGSRWVLYNVWTGGEQTHIHATHLDSGEEHVVVNNASSARVTTTPRGDYLLFERASIIFAAPFDRASAKVTGTESAIAEGVMNDGTRFAAYFDVAADGTLVYFPGTSFAEESRLGYVTSSSGTTPLNDDRMSFCEPVFAANGKKMAVLVKGKIYRSLVYDLERQTREFIVTGGDTLSVALSGDAQTLACTVNRDGGYGIDLISLVDGRRLGRVVQPGADYQTDLSWASDGKLIAFSASPREGTPHDIWLVEPRPGAEPKALVTSAGADTKPAISPLGTWIAYTSDLSGRNEVYLITYPDGATTRQISLGGGTQPAWSPDGKTLYYIAPQGLVSVSIEPGGTVSGKATVVYDKPFGQSDPIAREYAIAPDGRPLIVEPSERRPTATHLHVITNWHRLLP